MSAILTTPDPKRTFVVRYLRVKSFSQLVVLCSLISSCTPEQAAGLASGEPVPGFRLRVSFAQPLDGETVAQRIQAITDEMQFVPFRHPNIRGKAEVFQRLGVPEESNVYKTFTLLEANGHQRFRFRYSLRFANGSSVPKKGGVIESIDFIFDSKFGEPLSFEQWTYFCRLKTRMIPAVFAGDDVTVVRHPSAFTEDFDTARIVRAFGGNDCEVFSG